MADGTKPADDAAAAPAAASPPPPAMRRNDISMTDMSDFDTGDNLYHVRKSRLIRLINWWQVRVAGAVGWRLRIVEDNLGDEICTACCGRQP